MTVVCSRGSIEFDFNDKSTLKKINGVLIKELKSRVCL